MQAIADGAVAALVEEKLQAFERLRPEFERCFIYVQEVQGQRRFSSFPVEQTVHYLHALWICECKDRLLSVPRTLRRYEGERCLELLRDWQQGETAAVVAFLQQRLDIVPFADLTLQMRRAQQQGHELLQHRLRHGRHVLLNRAFNLLQALDTIFAPDDSALLEQVQAACRRYGHEPAQIEQQLAELNAPRYTYLPHRLLTRENMLLMNRLGTRICGEEGRRLWGIMGGEEKQQPASPRALMVIEGYQDLTSTRNPVRMSRLISQLLAAEGAAAAS
jgi:hypothetical protein